MRLEKEELLHQLEEKDKLRDKNEKLMESRMNILEQGLMNLACNRPYLDSMDYYVPKISNYQFYYFISCFLFCMCIKHILMIFFC